MSPAPPLVNRLFDRAAGLKFNIITKITVLYQWRVMVFAWLTRVYLSYWVHKSPPFLPWSPVHKRFLPGRSLDLITLFPRGNRSLRWEEICGSSEKSRSRSGSSVVSMHIRSFLFIYFGFSSRQLFEWFDAQDRVFYLVFGISSAFLVDFSRSLKSPLSLRICFSFFVI